MAPLPLVLLPGLDGTGRMFRRFVEALPGSVEPRIVAYPTDEPHAYEALEPLVERSLPREPFAILAESFGGPLALRVAAERPVGLLAVVLVATFVRAPVPAWMRALRFAMGPSLFRAPPPTVLVRALMTGFDADDELTAELLASVAAVRPEVTAARVHAALDVDVRAELVACPAPILYVRAERDALLRDGIASELGALRPDVELASIPAPHLVLQTRPREAAALVASFLARVTSSGALGGTPPSGRPPA